MRKDIINITLKRTNRLQQDYLGGGCHVGFDGTNWPTVRQMFETASNNMNPLMYQYIKIKSISVTWHSLKMYWLDIKPIVEVSNVIPMHSKPAFPKMLFFNSFMDQVAGGIEQGGYVLAGGQGTTSPDTRTQAGFIDFIHNMPRVLRQLKPGRKITLTAKEARNRWSSPTNWLVANPNFFNNTLYELTDPLQPVHADFTKSLRLPFFKYSMGPIGKYTIDSSEFDGSPFSANRQLVVSFQQTITMKFQCKLLRSDTVVTTIPV